MTKKTQYQGLTRETADGIEVKCPWCGEWQPIEKFKQYTTIPFYQPDLTPILQCRAPAREDDPRRNRRYAEDEEPLCGHIFAPTALAVQMRTRLLEGVETEE